MPFAGIHGNYYERLSFPRGAAKAVNLAADSPFMSNSISSASHVSSAQAPAQAQTTPQPARTNSNPEATKTIPLPHDTVNLSSQAQSATAAKSTHPAAKIKPAKVRTPDNS
jgi:hypothetical protein